MKKKTLTLSLALIFCFGGIALVFALNRQADSVPADQNSPVVLASNPEINSNNSDNENEFDFQSDLKNNHAPMPPYMLTGLEWLAKAQFQNGGFGAGTHDMQGISDPHAVQVDPATTALAGMAFIRTGSTHRTGPYQKQVEGVLHFLLNHTEAINPQTDPFTTVSGTQPQRKLGQNIDATFTSQFLSRILPLTKKEPKLEKRIKSSIGICVEMIEKVQNDDGSFSGGSWAGVLQSSMANSALEAADNNGIKVDQKKLSKSRGYQRGNIDLQSGAVNKDAAAGVSLYSLSSSNRASATNARKATEVIEKAKEEGRLAQNADVSEDNLMLIGVQDSVAMEWTQDFKTNEATVSQLQKDEVLSGFGNNGGEEFLSYMMASESMVITGGESWESWDSKMQKRLSKIQNPDGSWSGHHCITSPVFCTAATIMTLSTDRDLEYIASMAN